MEESNKKQNDSLKLYLNFQTQIDGGLLNYFNDHKASTPYETKESVFCLSHSIDKSIHFSDKHSKIEDIFEILFEARKSKIIIMN